LSNSAKNGIAIERPLKLILVALISAGLGGLLLAVIGIFKAPQAALIGIAVSVAYAHLTRSSDSGIQVPRWHLLALLVAAVFFRLPPVNYVSGGQDQGVYVNVAAHIVHSGGIAIADPVLEKLNGSSASKIYAEENAPVSGDFLLGIFHQSTPSGGALQFQFYHLFPIFMALIGGIFGLDASVFALTLLSILSVLFFYCLALRLTDRPGTALSAAMLLAVNPLHAFFSRFPVTEVPSLCFSLAASWLLVRFWRDGGEAESAARRWWEMLLSAGALACAFLIRMSGFMYAPIILLIGVVACLYAQDKLTRRLVVVWVFLVNAIYAATVVYGYAYSSTYVRFQLDFAFGKYLGPHWGFWVILLWVLSLLGLAVLYGGNPERKGHIRLRRFAEIGRRLMGPLTIAVLAVLLYKLYVLGWTDHYAGDPTLAQRWKIAQTGFGVFSFSSLVVAAEYVSPLLLLLFFGLTWARRLPGALSVLLVFVLMFLFYLVAMQWLIPYQPYYARYLVSEFVPYLILFVVLAIPYISGRALRHAAVVTLVVGGAYTALLSVGQLRASEQQGMAETYQRIASHVGYNDILLLDTETLSLPYQLIEMPFMLRYDRYVARISQRSLIDVPYLNGLQDRFDEIYLLSGSATPPPSFRPADVIRFREWVAEQGLHPPLSSSLRNQALTYLYVRTGGVILPDEWVEIGKLEGISPSNGWRKLFAKGWSIPESWGMWSDSTRARIVVPEVAEGGRHLARLELAVKPFVTSHHSRQRVRATVDGDAIFEWDLTQARIIVIPLETIPRTQVGSHIVELDFPDAVTPSDAGLDSADPRQLALGLVSARLVTSSAAQ
jgi:Dolichyl-phosphate-mannose-protein mannosyltransferase